MNEAIFVETQKFRQPWIYYILFFVTLIILILFSTQIFFHRTLGNNPISNTGYIIIIGSLLCVIGFFYIMELNTKISSTGIAYKFFPYNFNFVEISWAEIESISVKTYDPISDFGGWGFRFSRSNGAAITTSGNNGIQIILKNKKKILIGTENPSEVKTVLKQHSLHIT